MDTRTFCQRYNRQPPIIGSFQTPRVSVVRGVLQQFEAKGVCISASGMTADIVTRWLKAHGEPFVLIYSAKFQVWVVKRITEDQIEEMVA